MKKAFTAAVILLLCLLTASCGSSGSNAPSSGTEVPAVPETTTTSAVQTESSTEQTVAETVTERSTEQTTSQAQTTSQTQTTSASDDIRISDLPTEFVFSSGAGGWDTTLTLHPDGAFDGIYHDSDYMQLYYSTFNGKFGQPRKTGDHTYLIKIEDFHVTNDQDKVFYEESVEYIPSDPYGLENNTSELILYIPGTPLSEMPEECRSWLMFYENSVLAEGDFVLYNAQEGDAFFGSK